MRMFKRRKSTQIHIVVSILTMILGVGMLCGGCGNDEVAMQSEETAMLICARTGIRNVSELDLEKTVEYDNCVLKFSFWGNDVKKQEIEKTIQAFENEYPGIEIEVNEGNAEAEEEILIQQLQTGTAPDVNQVEWEWLYKYSADGTLFYDLYKEHEIVQLGAFGQEYLNMCTVAEELQALPANLSGKVFFFNEELFARAGIEVPDTLEELIAAGEIFRAQLGEEYYPLALTIEDRMELLVYYLQATCGKDWVVNGVLQYYAEDVQKGTEFLLSLEETHVMPTLQYARSDDSLGRDAGWSNGVYGGVFVDSSVCAEFDTLLPVGNAGVAAERFMDMGTGKGGYVEVSEVYAVSENSAHRKEAALFLNFLLNGEMEESAETIKEAVREPQDIAMEASFAMNYDYAEMMKDNSLYSDIFVGLSYGDYNAREAAQLLMDSFSQ